MEQYIKSVLAKKPISPATLKNRLSYIHMLYRKLESDATDLSFLNDKKRVMQLVMDSESAGTRKTRAFHVAEISKLDKSVKPDVVEFYKKQAEKLKKPANEQENANVMNEKQKEKHITIHSANLRLEAYLKKLYSDYGMDKIVPITDEDFQRMNTGKDRKNIYTFAKGLQECVMVAVYVWQAPLRNDWADLQITKKIIIPNKGNWLQIHKNGRMTLILNEYKTAKFMGKQKIPLSDKLTQLMTIWLDLLGRLIDKPKHPLYYSINGKGTIEHISNEATFAKQLSRITTKIWGKASTINSFRHAWEMQLQDSDEYKRMTYAERQAEHEKLLHGFTTGVKYNLQRRG